MDAKKKTIRNWLAVIVTVVFFAFQMYLALVKQLNPMLQSPLHLILALTLVFLYNPADKAYRKKVTKAAEAEGKPVDEKKLNAHAWMNWFDIPLSLICCGTLSARTPACWTLSLCSRSTASTTSSWS